MNNSFPAKISRVTWIAVISAALYFIIKRYREIMELPALGQTLGPADPDAWLRLTQVRQLLTDGGFFEHLVRNTNAPIGGITTPWTRPLDMLLVFFTRFTPAEMSANLRLMLAADWMAPVIGLAALFFIVRAARAHFNHTHVLWCIVTLAALNPWILYFSPGNSDHHGFLSMLWCAVLWGLARPLTPKSGAWTGVALGLMLWTSPEALLPLAAVYGLTGLDALKAPRQTVPLFLMTLAAAAVTWIAIFIEMPLPIVLTQITYDSLSLPYAVLMTLAAAGAGLLCFVSGRGAALPLRVRAVAASALVTLFAMWSWFPKFFKGPMVDVDPFIRTDFLPYVTEAQPFHMQSGAAILMYGWPPLFALFLWLATKQRRLLPGLLLIFTTGMMLASSRWTYYAQPVALWMIATTLPAWSAAGLKALRGMRRFYRPYVALWTIIFAVCALALSLPPAKKIAVCTSEIRYVLQSGQLPNLIGRKPLTLYTTSDVSGQVLFFTPYKIIAGNYHREGAGLSALKEIAAQTRPAAAREKLEKRKADALLVCPPDYKKESWISSLSAKNHPAWLAPVAGLHFSDKATVTPELFLIK